MRIMLVDDEERFLETTKKVLARKGHEVFTAEGGPAALELLNQEDIHVAILDVKMPEMDGITALKAIKELHPLVEVILLTGHAALESAIDGLKFGAADYLLKPVDIDELVRKAGEVFEKRRRQEEKIRRARSDPLVGPPGGPESVANAPDTQ